MTHAGNIIGTSIGTFLGIYFARLSFPHDFFRLELGNVLVGGILGFLLLIGIVLLIDIFKD